MTLLVSDVTIIKPAIINVNNKYGGYSAYSGKVAIDGVGALLRVTIERSDDNRLMGVTHSDATTGDFSFTNLADVKHILTAQDLTETKKARATTIDVGGGIGPEE